MSFSRLDRFQRSFWEAEGKTLNNNATNAGGGERGLMKAGRKKDRVKEKLSKKED